MLVPSVPVDPAYPIGSGGLTPGYTGPGSLSPASFGADPSALLNPAAFGGHPAPFTAGMGGIMPGPGYQLPPLQNPGYNPGGGFMPTPIGGMWNQIAQHMAGPMFMPQGTTALAGAPNPLPPSQPSGVTVPGFTPTPGSNYLAPNLYIPQTPVKTAPTPPPVTTPISIPPGTPLGGGGANLGSGFGSGYRSPMNGLPGFYRL